ncbi:hypothetical protein [Lyngbya sp. CCY1209]|jgi:hypothetical protein|uniref:hypothetical protein n=1 Tax=Lyngbya sp. CCY1209 TaxID=2886103 RepID=UPI002D20D62F|nr:hypothetical protein [Lyngbya sp. CCY1209]MEB3882697.1 hypothetical protein [Lyngbya sp. CCY1209]
MKKRSQWRDTEILLSVVLSVGLILLLAGLGATAQRFENQPELSLNCGRSAIIDN